MNVKVKETALYFVVILVVSFGLFMYSMFSSKVIDTPNESRSAGNGRRPLTRSVEVVDAAVEEVAPVSVKSSTGKNVNITINVN